PGVRGGRARRGARGRARGRPPARHERGGRRVSSARALVQRPSSAHPVSQPHDHDEREAERAADVVARGGTVSGWSFASAAGTSGGGGGGGGRRGGARRGGRPGWGG